MLQAGLFDGIFDPIINLWTDFANWVTDPIWAMILVGGIIFLLTFAFCFVISYFCEPCRKFMGIILAAVTLGVSAYLTGAWKYRAKTKERRDEERARHQGAPPRQQEPVEDHGPFDIFNILFKK